MINWEIPKGTLLMFSAGEYSDYGVIAQFVTLEDITKEKMVPVFEAWQATKDQYQKDYDAWKDDPSRAKYPQYDEQDAFIAQMVRAGLLLGLQMTEIHIGCYGRMDLKL